MKEKFYITTSIIYANAKPHIGHALELLQADVIARWQRLLGKDVFFLTGTDEHGIKVYQSAKNANKKPQEFVNENTQSAKELIKFLNISNTDFIRTTDKKRHWPAVAKIWELLRANGDIYKGSYKGLYSVKEEVYITKTEAESSEYRDTEIIEVEEENYLFRLSKYGEKIKNAYKKYKIVPPHRQKELTNFIDTGLTDISFSRSKDKLPWGIPVPGDDSQIIYVWCDALTNYLSALGYPGKKYEKYWPADIHVIGKDILRFHAIYWPAILMSAGLKLPRKLLVHGFITAEGKKMSKSVGNVMDPLELVKEYGVDPVRYYLLREIPTFDDGDYSKKRFDTLYNSELADKIGNLLSRSITMLKKYSKATVPKPAKADGSPDSTYGYSVIADRMNALQIDKALDEIINIAQAENQYIDSTKPWQLAETGSSKLNDVLYNIIENLRHISIMLYPFLPGTSDKIRQQLGLKPIDPDNFDLDKEKQWGGLKFGHKLGKSEILFPKN
ncbi:methionine--tRNA ligase [candidate division Kazan bacterium]|uniref:Methionine--tRNA ligase n=1 Tax=candidate division Kazan bacterium TaxID=2202143 RepID=A0A420ZDP9_UNCK3|nr:MAG: methionine--tRNA ligase [candidate division Kazan bacterium]